MSSRLRDLLSSAVTQLSDAGVATPRVDAEMLLAHSHGVDRAEVARSLALCTGITPKDPELDLELAEVAFQELVEQRSHRIPLQHLTGAASFRTIDVAVGPGVFVPRPETEYVTQIAIDELQHLAATAGVDEPLFAIDLCTGSGAIALSIAKETTAKVWAIELDETAHGWAQKNVTAHGDSVQLIHADARRVIPALRGIMHVVISNPPYIPHEAVPKDPEVAQHDPEVALYGLGDDGLEVPRGIIDAAAALLRPGGLFVMEHAEVQAEAVRDLVGATGVFEEIRTATDLTGRPRMVVARKCGMATHAAGPGRGTLQP